jgi:RluA family pseudouridine synthase
MPSRTVHISENGMRLDRFLKIHFGGVRLGRNGARLTVDGKPVSPAEVLRAGQVVALVERERAAAIESALVKPALSAEDRAFLASITLYEDEDIIVFDKPSGLAVHPGTRVTRDLDTLLAASHGEGEERPVLVHRLDKDTSGVIVAAKRADVARLLGKAFAGRDVAKECRAVVAGVPDLALLPRNRDGEGLIDIALVKRQTPAGGRMVAAVDDPDGQHAVTRLRIIAAADDGSRAHVALFPETGRQHQLRVHMALIGHPILGDALYGDRSAASRLLLHAHRLTFRHPRKGRITVEAPLPFGL